MGKRALPALTFSAVTIAALLYALITVHAFIEYADWWGRAEPATDWGQLANLSIADPYRVAVFRWSPPAAWIWVLVIEPLGATLWRGLHVAALAYLRRPLVIAFVLASFPFWQDVKNGNLITFVMVAAWTALAGSRFGTYSFLALSVLVPRPLMLPVLAYLLWTRPWTRLPFAGMTVVVAGLSLAAAQFMPFIERLTVTGGDELMGPFDWGPSLIIGTAWLVVGPILAAFFLSLRRFGLASLCAAPYWLQYYYLMLALELRRDDELGEVRAPGRRRLPIPTSRKLAS